MRLVRSSLLLLAVVTLFVTCRSKRTVVTTGPAAKDPRWAVVDSLSDLGQYATALERTEALLNEAQASGEWRTEFRAWMYRNRFQGYIGMDVDSGMQQLEARALSSPVPLKQLLYSAAADGWWSRYQMDRWRILERTNMQEDGADPATWSQATYMRKVIDSYAASLAPDDTLKRIPVGELGDLLTGDEGTRKLRPTVFDVLAHRALAVFTNSETRLTEPSWRFELDDAKDFDLFEPFTSRKLQHRDSAAWEFQAMRLYQALERQHLNDNTPDALTDVVLQRLNYVRDASTLPNKDSLYVQALEALRSRIPDHTCWAEVSVAIAHWHAEQGARYQRLAGEQWKWEKRTARDLCDEAIVRFPGSFGAKNAAALKATLEMPSIAVQLEEAVVPNEVSQLALTYTNTKHVRLRVVKDPLDINGVSEPRIDHPEWLLAQRAVAEWEVDLPDDGDLNAHLIELPIQGLSFGRYSLIVSGSEGFTTEKDVIVHAPFWVTRFMLSDRNNGSDLDLLVLDRWTGAPISGVKAWAYVRNRDYTGIRRFIGVAEYVTDAEGMVRTNLKGDEGELIWSLSAKEDAFISGSKWMYTGNNGGPEENIRTWFFTDRAIYRPGQEIFYKGIVTVQHGTQAEVKPSFKTTVRFFDVNGEQLDTANVITDGFGAFHGSFRAPQGGLTGSMRIDDEHGGRSFQVEEYKRPTFEVVFDPITSAAKLEQDATVSGVAKSYAGVPLDGAVVKWTVKRGARMPWWCGWGWRGLPWGQETEIASGEAQCDAQGEFTVTFKALADRSFPESADPTFFYTVDAEATDITGETQSASTSLNVGYRSIDIAINVGEAIDRNTTDSIDVRIKNLNGQDMDVPMDVRIVELVVPMDAPQRERLWERPDRILEGELQVSSWRDDPMSWLAHATRSENKAHLSKGKSLPVRGIADWTVGLYRIEVSAKDADGKEVKASKLVTVYDTTIQNTGFVNEAFHLEPIVAKCGPGEKAVLLLSSALPTGRVLMEVERDGRIAASRRFTLNKGQQRIELPVVETDRGGFTVHFLCVERGRVHNMAQRIDVPWTNKQLQVEWLSFRDKLLPGSKEEWRLRITGLKKEKVAAQLLGVMYDASLDHFIANEWSMFEWPMNYAQRGWNRNEPFGASHGQQIYYSTAFPGDTVRSYPELDLGLGYSRLYRVARGTFYVASGFAGDAEMLQRSEVGNVAFSPGAGKRDMNGGEMEEVPAPPPSQAPTPSPNGGQPVRTDFRETAFFFPDLLTDRDGSLLLRFTTPDALTRWKVMGLAHTKDLKLASFSKETVTSKPLMVVPNLPRFLREGDRIVLTAKINATEGPAVTGTAQLTLYDPTTNKDITTAFTKERTTRPFAAGPGRSATAGWAIVVPAGIEVASVRITANAAGVGDGEERPLPILTDKVLVTESVPLSITKAGTRTFTLPKLVNSAAAGSTLRHKDLKLEFTPNPAWYAVQALPYLMEFPHECAEQTFSRYYANRLATHIVEERPAVKKVFAEWSASSSGTGSGKEGAFLSALEKNPELKGVLLEETPWVMNAKDEGERKRRIALFFDLQRMAAEEATAMKKLRDMQLPNGAWPWWSGMQPSRNITQHILAGFGHLEALKAADTRPDGLSEQMLRNAVNWLDSELEKDYMELQRNTKKEDLEKYVPNGTDIQFLYARSFFRRWPIDGATRTATDFYLRRAKETWLTNGLQEQAMLVLAFARLDATPNADLILKSLNERATRSEELGMYWKGFNAGSDWWSFPTETHALMIEAFHEVGKDKASVDALRQYLLKLKQTTDWKTTKATSEACYALLLTGDDWLAPKAEPTIMVGNDRVKADKAEAGTGYFVRSWTGEQVKPAMGAVTVTTASDGVQWGALHWQYLERMDKVTPHESPFNIKKQVMLHAQSDAGAQLIALDKSRALKPGDKLTIRIELRTDRFVDYVHLKDLRAAGLEPVEAISGYKWQGGLGYYQSIRDAGMHFFFDRIAPGTYVFEYDLRVAHAGDFSNGITTAMCMYAPEFSSHSEGVRVVVGEQ
ncbi:MAG TPA: alpha-2-macroglobulin family protein [Flavobacteriales bacterium]|nr:alpha-2-macroglobulin family protein [Flavobacteriales bacterium]